MPSTQVNSAGGFSISVLTLSVLDTGRWIIVAKQGSVNATTYITIYSLSQSTSQTSQAAGGFFVIKAMKAAYYVQRGGTGPLISATTDMKVYPNDVIQGSWGGSVENSGIWIVYYDSNSNYVKGAPVIGMALDYGAVVLLPPASGSNPPVQLSLFSDPTVPGSRFLAYFIDFNPQNPYELNIRSPMGIFRDANNMFELIGNSSETTVYTFNGTLEVSDLTGNNNVTVGANQTVTIATGGLITAPTAFDPTTMDQWWTAVMPSPSNASTSTSTVTSTNTSTDAFSIGNLLSGNTLYLVIIVVIAVAVLGLLATRRRGGGQAPPRGTTITQTVNVLPPPAPPRSASLQRFCTFCGSSIYLDSKFCPKCGKQQPAWTPPSSAPAY